MPFATVKLRPGINTLATPLLNEAGYVSSQLGRFRGGLFEKIGGWKKFIQASLTGIPRCLHAWEDLNQNAWLSVGTTAQLSVSENAALLFDVTPQLLTTNSTVSVSTVSGSSSVTINDNSLTAALSTLDFANFQTPISVGGIVLWGQYAVTSFVSTTQFTISAASNATATVTNGGAVPVLATVKGSPNVTVTLANHGLTVGKLFVFQFPVSVGGLTVQGACSVVSVTDANNFVILLQSQAASTASISMNGGLAQTIYSIVQGNTANTGTPYGYGSYGSGPYGGTGSVVPIAGAVLQATDWTLDNWGQMLIACPQGKGIYYWSPNGSYANAAPISGAPMFNTGIFVSARYQFLIAYGSTPVASGIGNAQDPLWVRWCDQSNIFSWYPTVTNQAGGQRLYSGSRIVAGYGGPLADFLWTDLDLWTMNYLAPPFVFGFNKVAANCGIVGSHAFAALAGQVFWMSQSNFFKSDGGSAQVVPCPVWNTVFQDLDLSNAQKAVAWSNTPANEIWFFYPSLSGGIGECDKYAKINIVEYTWDTGSLFRSAAIDQSVLGAPISSSGNGFIYQHETGFDADGQPLQSSFQTGFFKLGEGEDFVFIDRIYPDMVWGPSGGSQNASLQITLQGVNYPGDTPTTYGPYTVAKNTEYVPVRIRNRYLSLSAKSSDLGSFWRLGAVKYRFSSDGRR